MKTKIKICNAEYGRDEDFKLDYQRKNPFVRAFPREIQPEELWNLISQPVTYEGDIGELSDSERLSLSRSIRTCFFPTQEFNEVYQMVYRMMLSGYETRNPLDGDVVEWNYKVAKNEKHTRSSASETVLLTGISGMGKSTVVMAMEQLFPHIIRHNTDNFMGQRVRRLQLVYLYINMPPDATRAAFCKEVIREVDRILGTSHIDDLKSRPTIDEMEDKILTIFTTHHLGLFIIDEFQNINVAKAGGDEMLLNFLAKICNQSDTPMLTIGTTDSIKVFKRLFAKARRISSGGEKELRPYAINDPNWKLLVRMAFSMQFVKKPVQLNEKINAEMHRITCGIPYCLFRLMRLLNEDAIRLGTETITLTQIRRIYNNQFKLVRAGLSALRRGKTHAFEDLMSVEQRLESGENDKAVGILVQLAKSGDFKGLAANELLVVIDDVIDNRELSDHERAELLPLRDELYRMRDLRSKKTVVVDGVPNDQFTPN